jgi:hypothetical protein
MRYLPLILLCVTGLAQAGIYKTYDKNGNVIFSDAPSNDAQEVESKPIATIPALPRAIIDKKIQPIVNNKAATEPTSYKVTVANIKANDTLRKTDPALIATIQLEPQLWKEHHLSVLLDGKQIGQDNFSPKIDPASLERGEHRLEINVFNKKKNSLATEVIGFFIQQSSVANKK